MKIFKNLYVLLSLIVLDIVYLYFAYIRKDYLVFIVFLLGQAIMFFALKKSSEHLVRIVIRDKYDK